MTTHFEFTRQLRERLSSQGDKVLLRVVVAPDFEHPREYSGNAILELADQLASSFTLRRERSVVLLLLPHSLELFLLQLGLVLRGHIPAILAWPTSRIDPEKYQRNLAHQLRHLPAGQLITLPRLGQNLQGSLPYPVTGLPIENAAAFEKIFPAVPVAECLDQSEFLGRTFNPGGDALFLQFSGGTTGAQKAIVVTAGMLHAQFCQLSSALGFSPADSVVSWLPMYHDMGLIACYWLPLWHGAASLQLAANDWVINPELLPKYLSRYRATFCWLPNFSFSYMSQRREQMARHDLASVRAWINCSEPVRLKSISEFAAAFADCGVRKQAPQASYAMAETVFAISQSQLDRELATIPRSRVRHGNHTYSDLAFDLIDDVYVSSGKPLEGTDIKIVAADGSLCPETTPGEIYVRTPSLFSGYWVREASRRVR